MIRRKQPKKGQLVLTTQPQKLDFSKVDCYRLLLILLLLGGVNLHAQRNPGVAPAITATPATADFNFPINPATGGYPATAEQQFQLQVVGANPDPTYQLAGAQGINPATDAVLTDGQGQTIQAGARLPAGNYTLTITVADPGQGGQTSNWSVDVELDSGNTGNANTALSGRIGRDLAPAQQQTPPPAQQQTPPPAQQQTPPPAQQQTPPPAQQQTPPPAQQQTPPPAQQQTPPPAQQGGGTNARPAKVIITPWGGGSGYYPSGTRFSVLLNTQARKIKIGTAIAVNNKPIAHSPKTTLGGNVGKARFMLRRGTKLNMGFVRFVDQAPELQSKPQTIRPIVEPTPQKRVAGLTPPSSLLRKIFNGNIARREGRAGGRVIRKKAHSKPQFRRRR